MVLSEPQVDAQTGKKVSRHQRGWGPEILLQNPAAGLFNRAKAYRGLWRFADFGPHHAGRAHELID